MSKGSNEFKKTIQQHLEKVASEDPLFAKNFSKENKNIDDCITYILNTVKKSGCAGFTDDEVYSMAIHYYDEDNIDVGSPITGNVVVNHHVELTPEEIAKAKDKAFESAVQEQKSKIIKKQVKKKEVPEQVQDSLFEGL